MLLEGKKALVTGSRRGIGGAIALALAREGCDIGLNDIEEDEDAHRTQSLIEAAGRRATFTIADISRAPEVTRLFDSFVEAHGRIDVLVNNAYSARNQPFLEIEEDVWDRTLAVCLKGYFLCSQRAAREMASADDVDLLCAFIAFLPTPTRLGRTARAQLAPLQHEAHMACSRTNA